MTLSKTGVTQTQKAHIILYSWHHDIRAHNQEKPLFLYLPFQAVHGPLQVPQKWGDTFKMILLCLQACPLASYIAFRNEELFADVLYNLKQIYLDRPILFLY